MVIGFAAAPVIVTTPEYLPTPSALGCTDTQTLLGVAPVFGVTTSQLPPDTEALKRALAPVLVNRKHTGLGGDKPGS
jgi:hypothetical protein